MNSILAGIVKKVSEALRLDNVTEKTESLLALREENGLLLAEASEQNKPTAMDKVYRLGAALGFACIAAATCVILLVSPASPVVVPLIVSGLAVGLGTGIGSMMADSAEKKNRAARNADVLDAVEVAGIDDVTLKGALIVEKTIDTSIAAMLESAPQEVKSSPLFQKSVSSDFNPAAQKDSGKVLAAFNTLLVSAAPGALPVKTI